MNSRAAQTAGSAANQGRCPTGLSVLKAVSHPLMRDLLVAIGKLIGDACVVAAERGTG